MTGTRNTERKGGVARAGERDIGHSGPGRGMVFWEEQQFHFVALCSLTQAKDTARCIFGVGFPAEDSSGRHVQQAHCAKLDKMEVCPHARSGSLGRDASMR